MSGGAGRLLFVLVAALVFVGDRVSKGLVVADIPFGTERQVLPFLWFANTANSGMAFGLARWATLLLLLASIAVAIFLAVHAVRTPLSPASGLVLGLVMGGTVGNGYDRLVHGTVTDWIALHWFWVFNIADAAVSVGVVLLVLGYALRRSPSASA